MVQRAHRKLHVNALDALTLITVTPSVVENYASEKFGDDILPILSVQRRDFYELLWHTDTSQTIAA